MDHIEIKKLNLKIQALGESFSGKAVNYENQIADLRVELTLVSQELDEARARIMELEEKDAPQEDE